MFTPQPLTRALAALALLGSLSLTACDSGEPDDDDAGEQELITQATLTLTPNGGGSAVTVQATFDADGTNPTFTPSTLTLMPGTTYNGSMQLRDTFNNEDITAEIREEADEHLFRYVFQPSTLGTVTITDTESDYDDGGGTLAVGLTFQVTTAASGAGVLNAVLYHFDDAPKTSSTATSDEIDVDVSFPVAVQGAALTGR